MSKKKKWKRQGKQKPNPPKEKEVRFGIEWTNGIPKERGYYIINYGVKTHYYDTKFWYVPVRNKEGKYVRKHLSPNPIVKNHHQIIVIK